MLKVIRCNDTLIDQNITVGLKFQVTITKGEFEMTKTTTRTLADHLIDICMTSLKDNGIDCFLGGSRRFGYEITNSDIDLILLCKHCTNVREVQEALQSTVLCDSELLEVTDSHIRNEAYDSNDVLGYDAQHNIHLSIFLNDDRAYRRLEQEHERIEDMLKKNVELYTFVRKMALVKHDLRGKSVISSMSSSSKVLLKDSSFTGSHIFRALRATYMYTRLGMSFVR